MLKGFKKFLCGMRIRNYIGIILLSFFVIFAVFFGIFIKYYNVSVEKNNLAYNRSIAESYSQKLNNAISNLMEKADVLCSSNEMVEFVESLGEENLQISDTLFHTIHNFFHSNSSVFDLILTKGEYTKTFYMSSTDFDALPILHSGDDRVKTAFVNNNNVLLIPINISKNMRVIGRCYIVVYQDMLAECLENKLKIGSTQCFVISETMQIIASPTDVESDHSLYLMRMVIDKTKGDEFVEKLGSQKYYINRTALDIDGIYFYNFTPCRAINSDSIHYVKTTFILFSVSFLLFLGISYLFISRFDNSIKLIEKFITEKKTGTPVKPQLFSHEISTLADEIDDMTDSIKRLQDENLQIRIAQNESKLRVLQSQINPHFLFNTLNCIVGMARLKRTEEIVNVTTSMADIMRYSLTEDLLANLKDELDAINSYLQIQQVRFPDRFRVEENIDESLLNEKIIRFSIQPLIENAVKYALEPLQQGGVLKIIGETENDDLVFKIIDNGSGFDDETYRELKLRMSGEIDGRLTSKGFGLGILNIHKRIQLYYGKNYGVDVERLNTGSQVIVRMPLSSKNELFNISAFEEDIKNKS